jgi:hypothetical protein
MSWQATLNIQNNTEYNITVTHNTTGDLTTIEPGDSWSNTTDDPNNTNALKFWKVPNVWFMQGSCSFGPTAGVWVDRGWMDPNGQVIMMVAESCGKTFTQTTNGGNELLAWNEFEDGGDINITFNPQDPSTWE